MILLLKEYLNSEDIEEVSRHKIYVFYLIFFKLYQELASSKFAPQTSEFQNWGLPQCKNLLMLQFLESNALYTRQTQAINVRSMV